MQYIKVLTYLIVRVVNQIFYNTHYLDDKLTLEAVTTHFLRTDLKTCTFYLETNNNVINYKYSDAFLIKLTVLQVF